MFIFYEVMIFTFENYNLVAVQSEEALVNPASKFSEPSDRKVQRFCHRANE